LTAAWVPRPLGLLRHLRRTLLFGLNVLHTDQVALAAGFARKGDDKFNGISWIQDSGLPRLDGCAAWLACSVERMVSGGDHIVVSATSSPPPTRLLRR